MDSSHATADVEHGETVNAPRGECLDQRSSQARWAVLPVGAQLSGRVACVELAIEWGVAGRAAVHRVDPSSSWSAPPAGARASRHDPAVVMGAGGRPFRIGRFRRSSRSCHRR